MRRPLLLLALVLAGSAAFPGIASAATTLTITPITWNVVGLDSNKVTGGPNTFPVGARVCDTGTTDAAAASAAFTWDTANANINLVESNLTQSLGTITAGSCADVYWTLVVTRAAASYNTTRRYHITASATGATDVSTPTPREIYVEKLVSQNRNSITSLTGCTTVHQGARVTCTLTAATSTNGYQQLSAAALFPTSIFKIVSTSVTYTAPAGSTSTTEYDDACQWDNVPTSATYRSCLGTGKIGGTVVDTYVLDVIGSGSATIQTEIVDFSGSSYHYNSDFDTNTTALTANPEHPPVAVNDTDSTSPSTAKTTSVLTNDSDQDGDTITITSSTQGAHGTVSCTTTQCTYTPANGFTGTDTYTYTISDGYGGTATATVTMTVATVVPAFGVDSPVPVIVLAIGLGAFFFHRRKRLLVR